MGHIRWPAPVVTLPGWGNGTHRVGLKLALETVDELLVFYTHAFVYLTDFLESWSLLQYA